MATKNKTAKASAKTSAKAEQKIIEQTSNVPPASEVSANVITMDKTPIERDVLRKAIVNDLMMIEGADKKAENLRLDMLLHAIALHSLGGLNLRPEALGVLRTKMITAKDGWCVTSFAPSVQLVWKGKAMTASKKTIMRQIAVMLHWIIKGNIGIKMNDRYDNGNGGFFVNTAVDAEGTPKVKDVPEELIKKAKGAPVLVCTFNELLPYANGALAEEGAPQASAIETAAQKLVDALNEKSAEDIPADAWNNLSIVAGRIATLFRERDKLQKETPAGQKREQEQKKA